MQYKVLGIMSGTSLDGLDLAYCHFNFKGGDILFSIEKAVTIPYSPAWREILANIVNASALELTEANTNLGTFIGREAKKFINHYQLEPDFIACHGHTVFHQPKKGFSLQIGAGYQLMVESGVTVINDFRSLDVALGGQGAPLVPIGDELLFNKYDFCLNLGGIANISTNHKGQRIAFDVCPANMVLNMLSQRKGMAFDEDGFLASRGELIPSLFSTLNDLDFYKMEAPKSLGYEWVSGKIFPLMEDGSYPVEDLLYTFSAHMARQIAKCLAPFSDGTRKSLYITGGGAYNSFFLQLLQKEIAPSAVKIVLPDKLIIEFKEALIFALLGVLRVRNEINSLSSVTGASRDNCGGQVFELK